MFYITQDNTGLIIGRYTFDIHGSSIPSDAVEVSEAIFNQSIQMQRPALVNGELIELPLPVPTQEQLVAQAKYSIYQLLDTTAQQFDYRNFAEVAQFVNSGVWKAEADALLAWQEAVWVKAYELLTDDLVSVDEFMAQLPKSVSNPD